ncbi:MAG: hypothetical protein J0H23_13690 [Micrococcales bacterium]|nr:hypothetical protein [Micrococcales bacterium]OJX69045.1 MAG: hypothetical protein BGO94_10730 [Micrococcales bacterium 72-143]
MARFDPRCRICADDSKALLVSEALAAGMRPAEILREHGATLGGSQSSLYRHVSAHVSRATFAPTYLPDGTTTLSGFVGGVVADWLSLGQQRANALAKGSDSAATSAARVRAQLAVVIAKDLGLSDDPTIVAAALAEHELLADFLVGLVFRNPAMAEVLAEAAHDQHKPGLAREFEVLGARVREREARTSHTTNPEKKEAHV